RIDIGGKFMCHSRMYLGASRFSGLLDLPAAVFEDVNLKQVLARSFAAPTIAATQHLRIERISPDVAARLDLPRTTIGAVLDVTAFTTGRSLLSSQRIFVPKSPYVLDVTSLGPGDARGTP